MSDKQPPYPADTKAKGWRFELDYERIDQSGTWALASRPGMEVCRPLLLMQWYVAWHQEPCGTLPSDEEVIAALMGIADKTWAKHRAVLMRGWWLASDGLLYHPTITKRVLEMLDYRRKTAERVAKHKAAKREQHAGNALPTESLTVKNDTGTGTGTLINTPPPQRASLDDSIEVSPMRADWQPSERFAMLAKLSGLPPVPSDTGLGEFKAYWLTQPGTVRTQLEWDNALVKSLKHEQARAASAPRPGQRRPGSHTGFDTKDYTAGVNEDGTLA